ncbi:MAG: DUF2835 domain-containing protein [Verrucomicrobia bacterium]|nr:DUF2835 domain-containing protein [Verrucomicrobiota bacterium]
MASIVIDLDISAAQYLDWYKGIARNVVAMSRGGLRVQFPANVLQRFVTPDGVQGVFRLTFDEGNKFVSIEKLDVPDGFNRFA